MHIKLIPVDSNHFIRYKCNITHCLDSQTLSEYIYQRLFLLMKNGVGTFTSTNKQQRVSAKRFVTFCFLFGSSIQFLLSVGIRSYFTQGDVCRKMGRMYLSIVEEYFSVEVTHNLRIALMNKAPPRSFSVDFIHFKYCFQFSI